MAKSKPDNTYEGMFLLPPSGTVELDKSIASVKALIERHGGKVIVIKKWDERKLAYEIKKQKRGLYIVAYFTAPGAGIAPMVREVNLSEDMLRVLVTEATHLNETEMNAVEPQVIVPREERAPWDMPQRDERPRRDDRPRDDRPRDDKPAGDRPVRPRREEDAAMAEKD